MQILGRLLLAAQILTAAALVPLPERKLPPIPPGWEPNRGQANPDVLFLNRSGGIAVKSQSIVYSPRGFEQKFIGSSPNPRLSFTDTLPGTVNIFTGAASAGFTGIPRHAAAELTGIYPGIDAHYAFDASGTPLLQLRLAAGSDVSQVVFEIAAATRMTLRPDGSAQVEFGDPRFSMPAVYPPPAAPVRYRLLPGNRIGLELDGPAPAAAFAIDLTLPAAATTPGPVYTFRDNNGNATYATTVPDAAAKPVPFPDMRGAGCGAIFNTPTPCTDIAVYKFTPTGELVFSTYLAGRTREDPGLLALAPDGTLAIAGVTDSPDFPTTATARQPAYAGPAAEFTNITVSQRGGDLFAAKLDLISGRLLAATYHGGEAADRLGQALLGPDGSYYFVPAWFGGFHQGLPVSPGALQPECPGQPCRSGYAARLSPALDRLLYGTYLPGIPFTAKVYTDGSLYYGGLKDEGTAILNRLNPSGTALVFASKHGQAETNYVRRIALEPDGSVWAFQSLGDAYRLFRLDEKGERILFERPIEASDIATDSTGNLHVIARGDFAPSAGAFLERPCPYGYLASLKLNPAGEALLATYLPANARDEFDGVSPSGIPAIRVDQEVAEVVLDQPAGVYADCMTDGAPSSKPARSRPAASSPFSELISAPPKAWGSNSATASSPRLSPAPVSW